MDSPAGPPNNGVTSPTPPGPVSAAAHSRFEAHLAHWYLESLEISGGFLSDVRLTLPRGLICIIGPRGSGKSTLAEALRLGIGGLPSGASKERLAFIKSNLGTALITLKTGFDAERPAYTIRRSYGQPPVLTTADGKPVAGVDLDRGSFLPLDAYSSLEIEAIADESLGGKRRALLDELCAADMQRIQLALGDQRRTLEANADAIKALRNRIANQKEQIEELGDVKARYDALPAVTAQAATPEFQNASKQRDANDREEAALRAALDAIAQLRTALPAAVEAAKRKFPPAVGVPGSQNLPLLAGADRVAATMWAGVVAGVVDADRALAQAETAITELQPTLKAAHTAQGAAYLELQQQNQEAVQAVEARSAAQREITALERLRKELADAEADLKRLQEERSGKKAEFLLTRDQISGLREGVAERLQQEAGKKVRIRVHRNADSLDYQQQLLAALGRSGTKNQDEIVQVLSQVAPEHLAQIIRDRDLDELETLASFGRERGRKILDAFHEKIDPAGVGDPADRRPGGHRTERRLGRARQFQGRGGTVTRPEVHRTAPTPARPPGLSARHRPARGQPRQPLHLRDSRGVHPPAQTTAADDLHHAQRQYPGPRRGRTGDRDELGRTPGARRAGGQRGRVPAGDHRSAGGR